MIINFIQFKLNLTVSGALSSNIIKRRHGKSFICGTYTLLTNAVFDGLHRTSKVVTFKRK